MKGLIFTEFLELIEKDLGLAMVEKIIEKTNLQSKGVYTAVGTYPSEEMSDLVEALSNETGHSSNYLLEYFGKHLFVGLKNYYPQFFVKSNLFDFLASVHNHIHVEVIKLYPEAELPSLEVKFRSEKELILQYESRRKLGKVAKGLLSASIEYFEERAEIEEKQIDTAGEVILYTIRKK
jgi:hypothetical protein